MDQAPRRSSSSKHPGLELIDARIRLEQTPEADLETRRRRQERVEELEKRLRWQLNEEPCVPLPTDDATAKADHERATTRGTAHRTDFLGAEGPHRAAACGYHAGPKPGGQETHGPGRDPEGDGDRVASREHESTVLLLTPSQREAMYREVREDIKGTDQKAMFCLVALVWVIVFLINRGATTSWFYGPTGWLFKDLVSFSGVLGLLVSAYLMLRVLSPSQKESNPLKVLAVKQILLWRGFWLGAVATFLALVFIVITKRPHPSPLF